MTYNHRLLLFQRIQETDGVANQVELRVLFNLCRAVGLPIAALVGSDGVVARLRQGCQLVPPRIPRLGKAMQKYDQWSLSCFCDMHTNAVCFNEPMGNICQLFHPPQETM